jgi:AcrR family transcriptional regulator
MSMNVSPEKLDLRIRRTYKLLWEALLDLMAKEAFESISVSDICARAMVHRTTFYKHYEDKYALLYHGIRDQLTLLFDELNLPVGEAAELDHNAELHPMMIKCFEHVQRNECFYRLMLAGEGIGKFYLLFRNALVEHFLKRSTAHFQRHDKALIMRSTLRAHGHAGVLVSTLSWWLENNCPYTPAQMAAYLLEDMFMSDVNSRE